VEWLLIFPHKYLEAQAERTEPPRVHLILQKNNKISPEIKAQVRDLRSKYNKNLFNPLLQNNNLLFKETLLIPNS